jgi:glycosyltransferase involved in cell wall biosynthesis
LKKTKFEICHLLYEEFPRDPRVRRYVTALNEEGIFSVIICSKKKSDKFFEEWNGNRIYRIPVSKKRASFVITTFEYLFFTFFSFFLCTYLGIKYRFRIIHSHTLPDFLIFAGLLCKLFGVKLILDLHELFPEIFIARKPGSENSWQVKLLKFAERLSINIADHVITIHDNAADIFRSRHKNLDKKLSVIMNGVEPSELPDTARKLTNDFIIMYNGSIVKLLNLQIVVRALAHLREMIPSGDFSKIKFVIYGDGPGLNDIMNAALQYGLKDKVIYAGYVKPNIMLQEILKADVCVLPPLKNIYSDLFYTIKLTEMVYLKIPVIATRLVTYQKYYSEDSLFYFESDNIAQLADRIKEVYYDTDSVKNHTENAFSDYQKVSWDKMKLKYKSLTSLFINN